MRHRVFFDDGLFFMSFSVALGIIAFVIPARGATPDDFRLQTARECHDLYNVTAVRPALEAWLKFNPVSGTAARVDLAKVYRSGSGRTEL